MISAQCPMKTINGGSNKHMKKPLETFCCGTDIEDVTLVDRLNKKFPVERHCRYCYTFIYNSSPLSLLKKAKEVLDFKCQNIRLNFTIENKEETKKVLDQFIMGYYYKKKDVEESWEFTRGYFNRK